MPKAPAAVPALLVCALALAGCGTSTTTAGFSGAKHAAAQAVANLQSAANAGEGSKICSDYLAKSVISKLGGHKSCETALKHQLSEVDNLEAKISSVTLSSGGDGATASVSSIHSGKTKSSNLSLVKEGGSWKVSGP